VLQIKTGLRVGAPKSALAIALAGGAPEGGARPGTSACVSLAELATRQMNGFGSMIGFELKGGLEAGRMVMDHVRLATLAVSLGGVETLIEHPASMTHAAMSRADREAAGFTDGLVRYSVGIEDVDDLIADLDQALKAIP
jgi:cystathionine beta-lyase/cystathionine gamma-synthase